MYTDRNFKTKKELKQAVAERVAFLALTPELQYVAIRKARAITVYQPNRFVDGPTPPTNGIVYLEGPHYPEPHRWYAKATLVNGEVVKVS
jgi:hypothetical protein